MTRDQFISLFFIALLLFVIYQIFRIFSPFASAVFWSAILAFAFFPVYARLRGRLKTHDTLASIIMTTVIFFIVVPPLVLLAVNVTGQAIDLYQLATQYVREGRLEKIIDDLRSVRAFHIIESHIGEWAILKKSISEWLLNSTRNIGNLAASQIATLTKNLFFVVLNIVFMTIMTFVFLKDGEKIYEFIYQIAPMEERNKQSIFRHINETFSAVIRGQVLTSLTQGFLAGIIFWFLGLPLPLLFGGLTFLTSMIPIMGAVFVWGSWVVYLFFMQSYLKAVILLLFGTLVISIVDNIMKPAIIGEKTKLPYFLLFFGILGGITLYGIMGIFLAPVILSLFFALINMYKEKYS
jgi:predicted PurR-regulated permease PerM